VAGEARLNQPDGIHPTSEGYQLVVNRIWPYLEPLLRR
jgi:acyl-CoA thioesterase-1